MEPKKVIECYYKGVFTEHETMYRLFDDITSEELDELPKEWYDKLSNHVDKLPVSEEGWSHMITVGGVTMLNPPTPEEAARELEEYRKKGRERTKFLREEFFKRKIQGEL